MKKLKALFLSICLVSSFQPVTNIFANESLTNKTSEYVVSDGVLETVVYNNNSFGRSITGQVVMGLSCENIRGYVRSYSNYITAPSYSDFGVQCVGITKGESASVGFTYLNATTGADMLAGEANVYGFTGSTGYFSIGGGFGSGRKLYGHIRNTGSTLTARYQILKQ